MAYAVSDRRNWIECGWIIMHATLMRPWQRLDNYARVVRINWITGKTMIKVLGSLITAKGKMV